GCAPVGQAAPRDDEIGIVREHADPPGGRTPHDGGCSSGSAGERRGRSRAPRGRRPGGRRAHLADCAGHGARNRWTPRGTGRSAAPTQTAEGPGFMTHLEDAIFDDDGVPEEGRRRWRRVRRGGMSCLALVLAATLVVGGVLFAFGSLRSLLPSFDSDDYSAPGHGRVEVRIDEGASGSAIGERLEKKGVVKTASAFTSVATAQPEEAASIQPGTYAMKREM